MSGFVSDNRSIVYGESLGERFHEMLRSTPWWAISVVIHFAILLFAYNYTWQIPVPKDEVILDADIVEIPTMPPVMLPEQQRRVQQDESVRNTRTQEHKTDIQQKDVPKFDLKQPNDPNLVPVLAGPNGVTPQGSTGTTGFRPSAGIDEVMRDPTLIDRIRGRNALVVWLFDESRSMKDDQQVVRKRVDDLYMQMGVGPNGPTGPHKLRTAVCGFGEKFHVLTRRPTHDMKDIKDAIEKVPIDDTGKENYLAGINGVMNTFGPYAKKYSMFLFIIMVTDEGGDDDVLMEDEKTWLLEATLARMKHSKTTLIVFGAEAGAFGTPHERTYDPTVPKGYSPWGSVNRGIDTAVPEMFPCDWRFRQTWRVPSGFGPYGQSRLCTETGGIYYLLRSASARNYDYEKLLSGYQPELASRYEIAARNQKNKVRRTIMAVVDGWNGVVKNYERRFRYTFTNDANSKQQIADTIKCVDEWIALMTEGIRRLNESYNVTFEDSPKHWEANRDLMLAQLHKMRFQLEQYKLALLDLGRGHLIPPPGDIGWHISHYGQRVLRGDPVHNAEQHKLIRELYQKVIEKHADTPWEVFAKSEMRDVQGWAIRPYSRSKGGPSPPTVPQ